MVSPKFACNSLTATSLISSEGIDSSSLFPSLGSVAEINSSSSTLLDSSDSRGQSHLQDNEEMSVEW